MPEQIAIRPALVWSDKPAHCFAAIGKMPYTLRQWEKEGLKAYLRGKRKRRCYVVDEVVAFIKATGK